MSGLALSVTEQNDFKCPPLSGCGTQHPHRALGGTCVLLAAAPTTLPCFRRWRRSSSLRSGHIQRKNYFNFAFVAACGPLQTHFHGWGRKGRWHICRLPRIPLCESWIQKRPQAFLNPKFKMKFLNLWPKRNSDDRRQWRKQGGVVGAAASKMRAPLKA